MIRHNVDTHHSRCGWELWAGPQQRGALPLDEDAGGGAGGATTGEGLPSGEDAGGGRSMLGSGSARLRSLDCML